MKEFRALDHGFVWNNSENMILSVALLFAGHSLSVLNLTCESAVNPMNVDIRRPQLSWIVSSDEDGQRQTAYQVLVATSPAKLADDNGDLWDSGRVRSANTLNILYSGHSLASTERVFWKLRIWGAYGNATAWSSVNSWTMGLLSQEDWNAHWIGASPTPNMRPSATVYLRSQFQTRRALRRATCFVSGLGQYEMWINGKRVGSDWLTPSWTQYAKTVVADSYDMTSLVRIGTNSIAIHLGNGMYDMSGDSRGGQQQNSLGPKKAICQILLEFNDGSRQKILSDDTWKWSPSPESYSGVFGGEDWDNRLEENGWKLPNFDDRAWRHVAVLNGPGGVLKGLTHAAPPLRLIETRNPVRITIPKKNVLVFDLGQNSPYVPRILVHGPTGTTVKLLPAELLNRDGTVDQETMRAGKYASYILSGNGIESWHPSFWYVGSQFWQVEAFNSDGKSIDPHSVLISVEGLMVHAAIRPAGAFSCSNTLFNKIHDLIWWATCSNFASVISDCPHREKSGWLEEDHLMGRGLMYAFDMTTMFRKIVEDMRDTQQKDGMVPTMAPEYFHYDGGFRDSVEWGGAYLLVPEMVRDWYGNQELIEDHYSTMKRYVDYLGSRTKDFILSNGLGDWNGYGNDPRTPVGITDTAYYYKLVDTLRTFAAGSGKAEDVKRYAQLASQIKRSFYQTYFDPATGKVGEGSQSAQATALDLGLIDPEDEAKAFSQLLSDVKEQNYTVSCGEVGHPSLLRVLTRFGHADLVSRIHLQTERPGYGYQLKKGLTTLAESWDARPISYNHFMLGHIMEWFYGELVGIQPDLTGSAFSKSIIKPRLVPEVEWAKGSYDSVRGRISCSWHLTGKSFHMEVEIPANTTATVWVPAKLGATIRMAYPATKSLGVFVSKKPVGGYESVAVPSGRYIFDSTAF